MMAILRGFPSLKPMQVGAPPRVEVQDIAHVEVEEPVKEEPVQPLSKSAAILIWLRRYVRKRSGVKTSAPTLEPAPIKTPIEDYPKGLLPPNGCCDSVKYSLLSDGRMVDKGVAACYGMIACQDHGIILRSTSQKGARLDGALYLKWMALCQKHGIVPPGVEAYVDKGLNFLIIPSGVYDRHLVYAALCCFRWADSRGRMPWQIMQHVKRLPVTFWQAFHYGMGTHLCGSGHSFHMISKPSLYAIHQQGNDLSHSVAIPVFFAQDDEAVKRRQKLKDNYTNTSITEIATKLGGTKVVKLPKTPRAQAPTTDINGPYPHSYPSARPRTKYVPHLELQDLSELLTKKWTLLYEIHEPTKSKLRKVYQQIKCNGKKNN